MDTKRHHQARWPHQHSHSPALPQSSRTGLQGRSTPGRWHIWMARLTARQKWAAAHAARYGTRFKHHQAVAMRYVRPATLLTGRQPHTAIWRITPQIHLAIRTTLHQTRIYAAPTYQARLHQENDGAGRAASPGARTTLVQRHLFTAPPVGEQPDTRRLLPPSSLRLPVLTLLNVVPLNTSNNGHWPNKTIHPIQAQPFAIEQGTGDAVLPRGMAERVEQVVLRSLQITQRVVNTGQRVELPAAARHISLQTARPAVLLSPAATDVSPPPPAELVAAGQRQARQAGMAFGALLPPVSIEQLTDQVVQAINHRTLAHRERMGQLYS